ncbi:peptidase M16 [Motiliproteus coralliicola]|uniref:Protease 3 n=1 Tax=Motiliproteus coralliicola TaxID=2283196 RepID=A0A369WR63_9GAMM|nr:insulinase family protein [Motiliproteus coralliicola]RDE24157.1 peptidase M16 [Motiliproteus coralliicola]
MSAPRFARSLLLPILLLMLLLSRTLPAAQIIQSPNDPRDYLAFNLDNGLKVLVISDPKADKAAASLEVGVGSGDDPEHSQGLAHFLEHMLFLGTDRYPEAGDYQAYISRHGGNHNAFTAHDRTNYFFDIEQSKLGPALDRFSRFFVAPLLTPAYVDRERHAVHSEYQSKLKEDSRRGYAALKQVINPDHPLATFAVGSLETLRDNDQGKLTEHLHDFYQRHYRAGNMALVVYGREPVTQLRAMVEQRFADIPSGRQPQRAAPVPLFKPGVLPAELQIKSLKELRQLSLSFPVPPAKDYYDRKPLHYLSGLLGHEGDESLLAELKRRGWANSLSAGPGFNYRDNATVDINIGLTRDGQQHYQEIAELVFAQIERIRQQGISDWRYQEQQQLSEIGFRFREPSRPMSEALRLAHKLRELPTRELLHGDYLWAEFDPVLLRAYLSYLRPDNLLLTLTAPDLDTDLTEPYFGTEYSFNPLTPALLQRLQQTPPQEALGLPNPNPYIPEQLALLPGSSQSKPELLLKQPGIQLWHQQDGGFKVPKANFYFSFRSPVANDSPRHHVMTSLLIKLLNDYLNPELYPAYEAGLGAEIYPHVRGFSTRISGYGERQQVLLEMLLDRLATLQIDPQRLAIQKQNLQRDLENRLKQNPVNQAFDALYLRVLIPRWSTQQQLQQIETIDAQQLLAFKQQLLARGEVVALAHGNIAAEQALEMARLLQQRLLDGLNPETVPQPHARLLANGDELQELEVDHNDSALLLYLQGDEKSLPLRARFGLLARILRAPFYTEVRTEKQRGYVVYTTPVPIQQHPGLAFVIQSPQQTPDILLADIDSFLPRARSLIEDLDPQQLASFKQGLINEILKQEQTLKQRTNRYWREMDQEKYGFDGREQLAAAIEAVTAEQLLQTFDQLGTRRLILQSTGGGIQPPAAG